MYVLPAEREWKDEVERLGARFSQADLAGLVRGSRLRSLVLVGMGELAELAAVDFRRP
jgi:hypothetical protein